MAVASVAKITAPITWDVNPKFRIHDLCEPHYHDVITLIKRHYFHEEPMCKSVELLQEPASVTKYADLLRVWMKDECSLVAVSEKSSRVVGALVSRINSRPERTDTYARVQIYGGEALESIMQLKNALNTEANVYEALGHDTYLEICCLCVHPSYKKKGVGKALIEACCLVALSMQIPIIAGIFTSSEDQRIAEHVGFLKLAEVRYNNWLIDDEVVFDDPGVGNYSAALMFLSTPNEETLKSDRKMREKEEKLQLQKRLRRRKKKIE